MKSITYDVVMSHFLMTIVNVNARFGASQWLGFARGSCQKHRRIGVWGRGAAGTVTRRSPHRTA